MSMVPTREQALAAGPSGMHMVRATPVRQGRAPANSGMTGRDVVRILRKRKLLIALSTLVLTTVAIIACVLWRIFWPLYTAEGFLSVNAPRGSELSPSSGLYPKDIIERLMMSAAQIVSRPEVLEQAITSQDPYSLELQRTAWFQRDKDHASQRLRDDVSISPVSNTNLLRVSFTARSPGDAVAIVNSVANAAQKFSQGNQRKDIQDEMDRLAKEKLTLTNALDDRTKAASNRIAPYDPKVGELEQISALKRFQVQSLQTEYTKLQLDRAQAEAGRDAVVAISDEDLARLPEVTAWVNNEQTVRSLQAVLINMTTELDNARKRYGDQHLLVKSIQARIESMQGQLASQKAALQADRIAFVRSERETILETIMRQLRDTHSNLQQAEVDLQDSVRQLEDARSSLEKRKMDMEQAQQDANLDIRVKTDQLAKIDSRLQDLRLRWEGMETVQVASLAGLSTADKPSWPKWGVLIPLGVFLGLAIGLGLAFLLELMDTSIKGPSDVSRRVDLPLLGMVPHVDDVEDAAIDDMRLAFMKAPTSLVSEAFRQTRTCLLFSGPAEQRHTLLITSPMPQDGRTTVALNLGSSIARGGRSVLVVDANFRQPALRTLFPQCPQSGLSSALVGQADWRSQVYAVEDKLNVLAAGPLPPNPAELLGSDQMRKLLEDMRSQYDQVIIDGAPGLVVSDSPVLSTMVDSVILVVRAGANTYGIVHRTRELFDRVGAHILGVVLNGVRVTAGGYLRKNYETYYEYHQPAQLTADKPSGDKV